jgi:hypothetical protein
MAARKLPGGSSSGKFSCPISGPIWQRFILTHSPIAFALPAMAGFHKVRGKGPVEVLNFFKAIIICFFAFYYPLKYFIN